MIRLVTGGVRSGKSRFAERLAHEMGEQVLYVATGVAGDGEMERRIARHRERRPGNWGLAEEPYALADALHQAADYDGVLIDCLSTWVANRVMEDSAPVKSSLEAEMEQEVLEMMNRLQEQEAILVTSEVGLGGVSMNPMGRLFQDVLGCVNQRAAEQADQVWMVISGIPWKVKG
ncbi:MAG: bifunctional adenosylcobinamide kinase/adenosylcobinamide-phosphate guanylyltransferase [Firmicutes bacterium]|uniref:Adenosylcobinamide kinase n=1 Tax=Melghirimyces thermohalophilus TaxID=1236220 RepID=A0A1G6KCT7_9BACL|nr:bifunctional adenosylcobinamide kinase/adenosylcobinamide-phosphate guanylyltransferase [Melghirimyces thermohalophilus]MDA8352570.1 bifunctional adenosylcobinamide kinase/adenosylcobinamide-phosphate guanylyltransferase [Bacillota bacterium]SDC28698.1 adenosylcobinamide kinase /adenosylcobinamide-phosphate guanylyltransferase [Melghirimyces thermohalophilus]